jgi:DNA-binding transcriptional LysR family regulator
MQQFISERPFDLFSLHLFQMVVRHRSFTKAAREAGISLSALSRQMQGLESRLGLDLLNRTTRSVEITDAGKFLYVEATRLIDGVSSTLEGLQAEFSQVRPVVRVGVSRSLAMAHMPGLFHAHQQRHPDTVVQVSYGTSASLLTAMADRQLDVAVFCAPKPLPDGLKITHRFEDRFVLIASAGLPGLERAMRRADGMRRWLPEQSALLPEASTTTGAALRSWLKRQGIAVQPRMELDSFDLMINLVASGFGVAWVPRRALALYRRKSSLVQLKWPDTFSRSLVVATRKLRRTPECVEQFVDAVLF